jgi:hypothetical protein
MSYRLRRLSDGAGDEGGESLALWLEGDEVRREHNARPRVGVKISRITLSERSVWLRERVVANRDWVRKTTRNRTETGGQSERRD